MSSKRSPMLRDMRPSCWTASLGGLVLAWTLVAVPLPAGAEDTAFDRTVRQLASHCARGPATACAARAFDLIDANDDGVAEIEELEKLDARLRVWTAANADELHPMDLRAVQLGFVLVDTIGIERGMMLYDEDGDGALSLEEMTADLVLDNRPLPEIVQAREIVDWPSLRRRFGATAMIFDYLDIR
jgi:Ca2+-binding EF-hand superfamily protein